MDVVLPFSHFKLYIAILGVHVMPPKTRVGFSFEAVANAAATRRARTPMANQRSRNPAVQREAAPVFEEGLMDIPSGLTGTSASFTLPPSTPKGKALDSKVQALPNLRPMPTPLSTSTTDRNPPYLYPDYQCSWCTRIVVVFVSLLFIASSVVNTMPVFINHLDSEHALVTRLIPTLPTIQQTYKVPAYSLSDKMVEDLRLEVAKDIGNELINHLKNNVPTHAAGFSQAAFSFLQAHHSARLYARSRGGNIVQHFLTHPLMDAWFTAVGRHTLWNTLWELVTLRGFRRVPIRIWDGLVCIKQDEKMPCPSLPYFLEHFEVTKGRYPDLHDEVEAQEFAYWLLGILDSNAAF